jgi:hypothetical protein
MEWVILRPSEGCFAAKAAIFDSSALATDTYSPFAEREEGSIRRNHPQMWSSRGCRLVCQPAWQVNQAARTPVSPPRRSLLPGLRCLPAPIPLVLLGIRRPRKPTPPRGHRLPGLRRLPAPTLPRAHSQTLVLLDYRCLKSPTLPRGLLRTFVPLGVRRLSTPILPWGHQRRPPNSGFTPRKRVIL